MIFKSFLHLLVVGRAVATVQYVGINIAGFEFGCGIDGSCPTSSAQPPLKSLNGADGLGQMQHFVNDDKMNIFRLPVSWQYLINNDISTNTLSSTNIKNYDALVQACLSTSAYCVLDLQTFARFNGNIIGQSSAGPTNAQFASLWSQLATKYASSSKVIFGLTNEPHDLDIALWAATCQEAVTAIRNAGATTQMILLPGTNFNSAEQFVSSGSGAALLNVTNPGGGTDGLIMEAHKYLDSDNSGTHNDCVGDNIASSFQVLAEWLRSVGRVALVTETGAGTGTDCSTDFCAQNAFINQNSDVYLGYISWAAGSFATSYILSLTPSLNNGKWTDKQLVTDCVLGVWTDPSNTASHSSGVAATTSTSPNSGAPAATPLVTSTLSSSSGAAKPTTLLSSTSPVASPSGKVGGKSSTSSVAASRATGGASSSPGTSPGGNATATATVGSGNGTGSAAGSQTTTIPVISTGGAQAVGIAGGLVGGCVFVFAVLLL